MTILATSDIEMTVVYGDEENKQLLAQLPPHIPLNASVPLTWATIRATSVYEPWCLSYWYSVHVVLLPMRLFDYTAVLTNLLHSHTCITFPADWTHVSLEVLNISTLSHESLQLPSLLKL